MEDNSLKHYEAGPANHFQGTLVRNRLSWEFLLGGDTFERPKSE